MKYERLGIILGIIYEIWNGIKWINLKWKSPAIAVIACRILSPDVADSFKLSTFFVRIQNLHFLECKTFTMFSS